MLSTDAAPLALALVVVAGLLRLRDASQGALHLAVTRSRAPSNSVLLAAVAVGLVVLAWVKTPYAPMALLIGVVPPALFATRRAWWAYVGGVVGTVVVSVGLWTVLVTSRVRFLNEVIGFDSDRQREWILDHPLSFLAAIGRGFAGEKMRSWTLPGTVWTFVGEGRVESVPGLVLIVAAILLVVAAIADVGGLRSRAARRGWLPVLGLSVAAAVLTVIVMYVGEAVSFTHVAPRAITWMEGRFLLPLLPVAALPIAAATVRRPGVAALDLGLRLVSAALVVAYAVAAIQFYL